jgi:uncharacterized membrane protein YraQ (UPF0718 family)
MSSSALTSSSERNSATWIGGTIVALLLWAAVYSQLELLSGWIVRQLQLDPSSHLGEAVRFFVYDTPNILMLFVLVVFAMGVLNTFFSAERTRALLAGRRETVGNVLAATLGIFTPFCSCSAVPLFIGFVSAGVPLGVTFSYLIAAPMVNEVAVVLLFGLVGWKVALAYLSFGVTVAIVSGWIIGRLKLEGWLQPWVRSLRAATTDVPVKTHSLPDRIQAGLDSARDIVGKVWLWIIAGIAVGAFIHGYVPADLLNWIIGKDSWWSVPAVVIIGVPMYSSAAGIIPVIEALIDKGVAIGTVLAFMMAVIALSLPEMLILRKVLTLRLLAVFVAIVATGILVVGYLFNALFG